ncbi:hypothetical protein GUJ93_ZPchr0006g40953 [Zizania palustris]|uniref:Phytocyanin domain-containing protein n=1 Tax=Zizania palustris TaxID=103762 RepID=A0A8J5W282_ZIZPA|nr:hypothetical protein GUJ93_ZPchr0006g40953 [Zizania palustris]
MAKGSSYGHGLLGLACFALVVEMAGATQFQVGGANGWSVPGANAESYNDWAEKNRFQIGDSLVFVYPKGKDSVLLVEPADYNSCNTSSYDKMFADGNTSQRHRSVSVCLVLFPASGVVERANAVVIACTHQSTAVVPVTSPRFTALSQLVGRSSYHPCSDDADHTGSARVISPCPEPVVVVTCSTIFVSTGAPLGERPERTRHDELQRHATASRQERRRARGGLRPRRVGCRCRHHWLRPARSLMK